MSITTLLAIATGLGVYAVARKTSAAVGPVDANGAPLGQSKLPFVIDQPGIIELVKAGKCDFHWRELPGYRDLEVFADALSIQGVRLPVSARTTATIARLLNATPTTALLEDIIFDSAEVRTVPPTQDYRIMMSSQAVLTFNKRLNEQLAAAPKPPHVTAPIVSCVGKSWVINNKALRRPGYAVNYGLHRPDGRYQSVDGESRVWQQPSTAHDPDHWDYSQTCRLCRYQGGPVPIHRLPSVEDLRTKRLWVNP